MFDFLKTRGKSGHDTGSAVLRDASRKQAEECLKSGNLAEAERIFQRLAEENHSAPRTERIELYLDLAEVQRKRAAPELARSANLSVPEKRQIIAVAEKSVRAAIELATSDRENDPHEFVVCMDALAALFEDAGDFASAETVEREALRLGSALPNPNIGLLAARTHRVGIAAHRNGHTEESVRLLEKSIQMHEKRYGPKSPEVGEILTDCGGIFRAQGDHARAKYCLERAFQIHAVANGTDAPETFADVEQLARVLQEGGDIEGASFQYERALEMKIRKVGFDSMEAVAEMQFELANRYIGWNNLGRARELLEEAVGEFRRHGGARLAVALEVLGQVEELLGHYEAAVQELEKAGSAWEKCGPARVMELIRNLDYRADLLDDMRRTEDAIWLREKMAKLQGSMTAARA